MDTEKNHSTQLHKLIDCVSSIHFQTRLCQFYTLSEQSRLRQFYSFSDETVPVLFIFKLDCVSSIHFQTRLCQL